MLGQSQKAAGSEGAMKLSTETKVYAFFVTAFAGVVILGFLTYRSTQELIVNNRWVAHTHQVRQSIADLLGAVLEAENKRRDYLFNGDSRYLAQFLAGLDRIPPATKKIIELTADNPDQQPRIAKLKSLTDQSLSIWAATADAARATRQAGGQIPPLAREIELRSCLAELTSLMDKLNASEDNVLRTRTAAASESGARTISVVLLGGGFSTLVVLLAIGILRRDLAEKRRAAEALRKREAQLREAQRVASVGSFEWITETDAITWSEELYHIAGRDPKETLPNYKELIQQLVTPESLPRLAAATERALKTGLPYALDLEIIRPDGTTRWIATRGEVVRETSDQITKIRGTAQDITERKRV